LSSVLRSRRTAALAVGLVLLLPEWPRAHEIPADVTIQAFVVRAEDRLSFLVRVPLVAMRDYDFPVREPGYLILGPADSMAVGAAHQWLGGYLSFLEDGRPLPAPELVASRISLPGDRAFLAYERARSQVLGPPLDEAIELPPGQAMLDALFELPVSVPDSRLALESGLAHLGLRTQTVLRFVLEDGSIRPFRFQGDPGRIKLNPRWWEAAASFTAAGFRHILDGIDHLLFLLCLVIPVRSLRALVPVVTSFAVAHSVTLIASAFGVVPTALWFPAFIEALIALSIVYMAFENILGLAGERRWQMAFGFGLVHGFGFSFALSESLQFAGSHLLTSLLAFNVGVELGQLLVLAIAVPLLGVFFRRVLPEMGGVIVLSAIVAHTGWHWLLDRAGGLTQFDYRAPAGASPATLLLRWLLLLAVVAGVVWLLSLVFRRLGQGNRTGCGHEDAAE